MNLIDIICEVGICPVKVASTLGGEYHSACPLCGGKDRFVINPNKQMKNCYGHYWCRQCGTHGDSIQFCRKFLGISFKEAAERANANITKRAIVFIKKKNYFKPVELVKPSDRWLFRADVLVEIAHQEIWKHPDILRCDVV